MRQLNTFLWNLNVFLIFALTIFGIFFSWGSDNLVLDWSHFSIIIFSGILLITCILIALKSDKHFNFILPFVLLAFPAVVNHIFPGIYLENSDMEVVFPLITHIDVFLVIILLVRYRQRGKLFINVSKSFFNIAVFLFLLSTLVNMASETNSHNISLLMAGIYPVRYLILFGFIVSNIKIKYASFIYGLVFCVFFLFLESYFYSLVYHKEELTSASLGNNTFGNIIGQITLALAFFYYHHRSVNRLNKYLFISVLFVGILVVLQTHARMALLAMFMLILFIIFPFLKIKSKIILLIIFVPLFIYAAKLISLENLLSSVSFYRNGRELTDIVSIDRGMETNSLITRLELFQTSLNMLFKNFFFGIGFGLFNVYKYSYGFGTQVIIDSHNGYLFLLSQLGLVGVVWIVLLYIYPLYMFFSTKDVIYKQLCLINSGMAICELSNAGIFKYSIISFLIFHVVLLQYVTHKRIKNIL